MARPRFILLALLVLSFSLATYLQPRRAAREKVLGQSNDMLALLLGDTRRMLANEFFAKADAYFHGGVYPSIFDVKTRHEENHMAEEAIHGGHESGEEHYEEIEDEVSPARDWIERFGRHFIPYKHVHLTGGAEREMLPWLQFSVEMDPHRVETYAVTAYWLRHRLGKVDEAEKLLHKGLSANPNNPQLLYELGRLYYENRKDLVRARNVWLAALRRWHEVEETNARPNEFLLEQILGGLALLEEQDGHREKAIEYLEQLKAASPVPAEVERRINELKARPPVRP